VRGAQIADAIAKEENLSLTEAFQIIESAISGRNLEPEADAIRIKHATRIEEVAVVYAKAGQRNIEATVTGMIRSRCSLPNWTLEDTRNLDKALFDAIWQLAQDEQAAEAMPTNPPSEDDLKKPQPVTAKRKAPIGLKSSGS